MYLYVGGRGGGGGGHQPVIVQQDPRIMQALMDCMKQNQPTMVTIKIASTTNIHVYEFIYVCAYICIYWCMLLSIIFLLS